MAGEGRYALRKTAHGWIGAAASEQGLKKILLPLPSRDQALEELGVAEGGGEDSDVADFLARLERYLEGEAVSLSDPWDEEEGTPFQRAVWKEVQKIPRGQTRTYGEVARALGRLGAARAVGQALTRNPLPILVPCHRVVQGGGSLGGYAGGRGMKRRLLALEGAEAARTGPEGLG